MSIINTSNYADFKTIAATKHFLDVFYFSNGSSLFIIYAFSPDGLSIDSGNLVTQPASFSTDFPNAISLTNTIGLA